MLQKPGSRAEYWRSLIAKQLASGLSAKQWCQQAGVSKQSFYAWRLRLSGKKSASSSINTPAVALPVTIRSAGSAPLEIHLPGNVVLHVRGDCDPTLLRNVVDALRSEPGA
jgi:hypothetical protein